MVEKYAMIDDNLRVSFVVVDQQVQDLKKIVLEWF
jgi:hypothetical protein